MANRKALVPQADLTRILKAHRDAGIPVARTEVSDGKVIFHTINSDAPETAPNEWDEP